jgi:hypothetical protein
MLKSIAQSPAASGGLKNVRRTASILPLCAFSVQLQILQIN